jgi:hypothetical protein
MSNHYKFWIVLSFLVVFAAGLFSGLLLDRYVLDGNPSSSRKSGSRDRRPPRFPTVDGMAEELALSDEQRGQLENIFKTNEQRIHDLHAEVWDLFGALRIRFLDEIKSILSEEQIKRFNAMLERFEAQRRADMEKRKSKERDSSKGASN